MGTSIIAECQACWFQTDEIHFGGGYIGPWLLNAPALCEHCGAFQVLNYLDPVRPCIKCRRKTSVRFYNHPSLGRPDEIRQPVPLEPTRSFSCSQYHRRPNYRFRYSRLGDLESRWDIAALVAALPVADEELLEVGPEQRCVCGWGLGDSDRAFVLLDQWYKCPECSEFAMRFFEIGLWD